MNAAPEQPLAVAAPTRRRRRVHVSRERFLDVLYPAAALGAFLLAWELWVRIEHEPPYIMVPFSDVARAVVERFGLLMHHSWVTITECLYGMALGVVIGVAIACLIASAPLVAKGLLPLIVVFHVIPVVAIAPVLSIWFGFGLLPKVLIVANFTFFPVMLNTLIGLRATTSAQLQLFRSTGAGTIATLVHLRLPNALPAFFVGLRLASTLALIGAVVAEYISAVSGLGYYVVLANGQLDTKSLMVGVIYLYFVGTVLFGAVVIAERIALPWHVSRRAAS